MAVANLGHSCTPHSLRRGIFFPQSLNENSGFHSGLDQLRPHAYT